VQTDADIEELLSGVIREQMASCCPCATHVTHGGVLPHHGMKLQPCPVAVPAVVPLARFAEDQVFTEVIETQIKAVYLVDGDWYVRLDGDLAGRVTGAVYDASQGDDTLVPIPVSVSALCWAVTQGCCQHTVGGQQQIAAARVTRSGCRALIIRWRHTACTPNACVCC
jgi:hypothetical protein